MSAKLNRPPAGKSWIWLTLEMMKGDAWRSASINTRRFVDFLMVELMENSGRKNGDLRAPYEQLQKIGISERLIAASIYEAEELGLVDCFRGGMRVATRYALTWLPGHDGRTPTDRWREYRNPNIAPWPVSPKKVTSTEAGS
jgi:hypothetical protein